MDDEIHGLDQVKAKLRRLGNPRKAKNAATRSARKSMNIVKKEAVSNAKAIDDTESPERIWKNIVTKSTRTRGTGFVLMRVGVKGGARQYVATKRNVRKGRSGKTYKTDGDKSNPGGDTFYWRFIELGTAYIPAQPFLRIALYNNTSNVQSQFVASFSDEVIKELNK